MRAFWPGRANEEKLKRNLKRVYTNCVAQWLINVTHWGME